MRDLKIFSPIPVDVEDQTLLTRSVAQGIYSSLDPRRSEIYFEEARVDIYIRYSDDFQQPTGTIRVDPERVCIVHSVDPFEVTFYEDPETGNRARKARHVRWVVHGLASGDRVVIRPKEESPEFLFNYLGGSVLEIPAPHNSIASGLPFIPHFEKMPKAELEGVIYAVWRYGVEVWRGERQLFSKDPEIYIEGDYNH